VGNPRSPVWNDPAGVDPETGEPWKVHQMVKKLEEALGRSHAPAGAERWRALWAQLTAGQRNLYNRAGGWKPSRRR
jgi:hypothetical protein